MPFKIPDAIKQFDFKLSEDGLPLAKVILLGGIRYVEVCPGCSCLHQLPMRHSGDTYTPRCLLKEWARPDYKAWIERYPDAPQHRAVKLVTPDQWASLVPAPLAIVKAKAKAKAPKARTRRKAA